MQLSHIGLPAGMENEEKNMMINCRLQVSSDSQILEWLRTKHRGDFSEMDFLMVVTATESWEILARPKVSCSTWTRKVTGQLWYLRLLWYVHSQQFLVLLQTEEKKCWKHACIHYSGFVVLQRRAFPIIYDAHCFIVKLWTFYHHLLVCSKDKLLVSWNYK